MKKILRKITKSFSARSEEPIPVFDITGCVPMSFGVMFKCVALTDVTVKGNMTILLVNGQEKMETQIINAEKESVEPQHLKTSGLVQYNFYRIN